MVEGPVRPVWPESTLRRGVGVRIAQLGAQSKRGFTTKVREICRSTPIRISLLRAARLPHEYRDKGVNGGRQSIRERTNITRVPLGLHPGSLSSNIG